MFDKSDYFILSASVISLVLAVYLWVNGEHNNAIFVGLWVPTILGFGNYMRIKRLEQQ